MASSPTINLFAALAIAVLLGVAPATAAGLNAPFATVQPVLKKQTAVSCDKAAPAPVVALNVSSIYNQNDPSRSQIDEDQFDEYSADMKVPRDFVTSVAKYASNYVASEGKRVDQGMCALAWLDAWAKGKALTDFGSRQSALSSTRLIAGLAVAYLAVRPVAGALHFDTTAITGWLGGRAADFISVYAPGNRSSDNSNHRYWGGFAVAASGVAVGNKADLDWGVNSYKIGVCQITADGALPLELKRKSRARNYHLHALGPLVMIAELAAANGIDAYGLCGGAIHRLVKFSLGAVTNPALMEKLAGATMEPMPIKDDAIRGDRFAWVDPYFKRFGGSEADYGIKLNRPLFSSNFGGRWTAYANATAN